MTPKRKKTQDYILEKLNLLDPTKRESGRYKKMFDQMTDKEFDDFMCDIRDGKEVLYIYHANAKDKVNIETYKQAAKAMGIKMTERIRMWDPATQTHYLTPHEYVVFELPVRRMSQFQDHKLSVPEGDDKIDVLSGQVVREDKAGSLSQVETQSLYAKNLNNVIVELIKYRGGDISAFAEYKRELEETGRASIAKSTNSVPRSAVILDVFLSGMHIESNAATGV